jgi:threonylcarbamoyladenosine tRNA methylthiotransferase MtaB
MRRKYTVADYKKIIGKIMAAFPNAGIGADIITGFPGETKEQFENTFSLLKELPITHFHVFPYSKRKNTTAAKMENHIHSAVKKDRVRALIMFGDAKLNLFTEDQVGKKTKVLFERRNKQGLFEGYSSNYLRVQVATDMDLSNMEREVFLTHMDNGKLCGELVQ